MQFLYSFCLSHFMNTKPGFRGVIKQRPEDFVVIEIDQNKCLATVDNQYIPDYEEWVIASKRRRVNETSETVAPDNSDLLTHKSSSHMRRDLCDVQDLSELIDEELFCDLMKMSRDYQETKIASDKRVNLGTCDDKALRTALHLAVRRRFPSLKTLTERNIQGEAEIHVVMDTMYQGLIELLPHDTCLKILLFASRVGLPASDRLTLPPDNDKEHRTKIHQMINRLFGAYIESKTHQLDEGPSIQMRLRNKVINRKRKMAPSQECQQESDDFYVKFCLQKTSLETLDAIQQLTNALGCKVTQVSYAGTKDRKAVTTQFMTMKNVTAKELAEVSGIGRPEKINLGTFHYTDSPLRLGDLWGNRFHITLRNVLPASSECTDVLDFLPSAIKEIENHGFVNYFGEQRFGIEHAVVNAPRIGLAMLQDKHIEAVDLILSPELPNVKDVVSEAKRYFQETKDVQGTLSKMPLFKTRERIVLQSLKRHGYTPFGATSALMSIPYNMRMLYVHSFTSLIWNHLATFRLDQYGHQVIEGDLVINNHSKSNSDHKYKENNSVCIVTSEDLKMSRYSLSDVILPLVGVESKLPLNRVGEKLTSLLTECGLVLQSFRLKRLGLHLPGAYRKLIARPHQLTWKLLKSGISKSSDGNCHMMLHPGLGDNQETIKMKEDQDIRNNLPMEGGRTGEGGTRTGEGGTRTGEGGIRTEREERLTGDTLQLMFDLESSSYATIFLRELMKENVTVKIIPI